MGTVTAGKLKNPIERDQICEHDLGYFALTKLRTSPDYKAKIKKDMFCNDSAAWQALLVRDFDMWYLARTVAGASQSKTWELKCHRRP